MKQSLLHFFSQEQNRTGWVLLLILLLGFFVRVYGYDWGLPHRLHPDEWKYVFNAVRAADGELDTQYYKNPTGFTYALAVVYKCAHLFSPFPTVTEWYSTHPHHFYAMGRILVAGLGALTIPILFWLARLYLSNTHAYIASFLYAITFLAVRDSHFAVNDIPLTFCVSLSLLVLHYCMRYPSYRLFLGGGLLIGISIGIKYNAVVLLVPLCCLLFVVWQNQRDYLMVFPAMIGVVAGFLLMVPGFLFAYGTFVKDIQILLHVAHDPTGYSESVCVPSALLSTFFHGLGVIPSMFALLGFFFLIKQDWKGSCLLSSFILAYLATLLSRQLYFSRFVLPIFPLLGLLAAAGLEQTAKRFSLSKPFLIGLTIILCAESLVRVGYLFPILHKKDSRVLAYELVLKQANAGQKILADPLSLPYIHHGSTQVPPSSLLIVDYNQTPKKQLDNIFPQADGILVSGFTKHAVGLREKEQAWKAFLLPRHGITTIHTHPPNIGPIKEDEVSLPLHSILQAKRSGPNITLYE